MGRVNLVHILIVGGGAISLLLVALSDHGFIIYLALEGGSLSFLVVMLSSKFPQALEGAVRYFLASALSSIILLLSCWSSLLLGGPLTIWFWGSGISGVLLLVAVSFKLSLFPLHFLFPDIIESAPLFLLPVWAGWSKVAIFILFIKSFSWYGILGVWGTLWLGAFGAVTQAKLLRGLAFASINTMGWLILGVTMGHPLGLNFFVVFVCLYAVSFHVWFCWWRSSYLPRLTYLVLLGAFSPFFSFIPVVLVLATSGLPPLAAFWWKWSIVYTATGAGAIVTSLFALFSASLILFFALLIFRLSLFSSLPSRALLLSPLGITSIAGSASYVSVALGFLWPSICVKVII